MSKQYINNTRLLDRFLFFQKDTYYKFVIIIRKKDGKNTLSSNYDRREIIVKNYLISSKEELDMYLPDMIKLTDFVGGRLYVTTDRKDIKKTLVNIAKKCNDYLAQLVLGNQDNLSTRLIGKLTSSATSEAESSCKDDKKWLFDIDTKDITVKNSIYNLCGENWLATLETVNGYHIIAKKKFRTDNLVLPKDVTVKDNALTLVYTCCGE